MIRIMTPSAGLNHFWPIFVAESVYNIYDGRKQTVSVSPPHPMADQPPPHPSLNPTFATHFLTLLTSALKTGALHSSETLAHSQNATKRNNPEEHVCIMDRQPVPASTLVPAGTLTFTIYFLNYSLNLKRRGDVSIVV